MALVVLSNSVWTRSRRCWRGDGDRGRRRDGSVTSTLHRWIGRYLAGNVAGLADGSHRPVSCPHQATAAVEVALAEMRRKHPRWESKRIRMQLLRAPVQGIVVPSERTINGSCCDTAWPSRGHGSGPRSRLCGSNGRDRCSCAG